MRRALGWVVFLGPFAGLFAVIAVKAPLFAVTIIGIPAAIFGWLALSMYLLEEK